jgi:hypothetical protein
MNWMTHGSGAVVPQAIAENREGAYAIGMDCCVKIVCLVARLVAKSAGDKTTLTAAETLRADSRSVAMLALQRKE